MLKKLLPKEIWKTKITSKINGCFYDNELDYINFNKRFLLSQGEEFINIFKEYNQDIKTNRDYLIFCLLHELGHRYYKGVYYNNHLTYMAFNFEYEGVDIKTKQLKYWELPNEKIAMDFAKHFFKLYKEKQNETQKI
jgi:hypothetical protein